LHEWLTGRELEVPEPGKIKAVNVLDPKHQYGITAGEISSRHEVIDNFPGTRAFCPLVSRTDAIEAFLGKGLNKKAQETHADIMARAAAFLLLNDSRASFEIEGEKPSPQRAERWAKAISEAGTRKLTTAELARLQHIVIEDARFVHVGLRTEGGFVGTNDRRTQEPIPVHISARAEDLPSLVEGIVAYDERVANTGIDPVLLAAAISFGFAYVHPFEDGNGRLHRWLIHHVLAVGGYNPPGVAFPVSAAIYREIPRYTAVLESYSKQTLMPRKKEESTVLVFVVHWTVPSSWGEGRSRALRGDSAGGRFQRVSLAARTNSPVASLFLASSTSALDFGSCRPASLPWTQIWYKK
jgi:hypothetical protein